MRELLAAGVAGILFALGLARAGMTRPSQILAFLDVAGPWSGALLAVMAGAIAVYAVFQSVSKRWQRPLLGRMFHAPTKRQLDGRLLFGAALFGIGWGLGGFCPGPALVSLAGGAPGASVFVLAMILGQFAERQFDKFLAPVLRTKAHFDKEPHHAN